MITNIITSLITILNLRKNIFKLSLVLVILTILGILSTILIRLHFFHNILDKLNIVDKIFILLVSCSYSYYLLINLIYNLNQSLLFFKFYNSIKHKNKFIFFGYYLLLFYSIFFTFLIFYINYLFMEYINFIYYSNIYFINTSIFIFIGIYYSIYYKDKNFNLNINKISNITKIMSLSFILLWLIYIILIKYNILYLDTVYCQGDDDSSTYSNLDTKNTTIEIINKDIKSKRSIRIVNENISSTSERNDILIKNTNIKITGDKNIETPTIEEMEASTS
jgi:hypothetical protein